LPVEEIGRISQESGIGHRERSGNVEETFFTYAELQKICVMASCETVVTH
jgi:hypothetical protein